jgi:hypothetical protein
MSSTTANSTPELDAKEESSKGNATNKMDFKGFIIGIVGLILLIIIYFFLAGFNLYLSKLAQSNILPTDINCQPYTTSAPQVQQIVSNIFSFTGGEGEMGQPGAASVGGNGGGSSGSGGGSIKMQFAPPPAHHILIDPLRKANGKGSHFLANYLISIIEHIFQFNYSAINMYYNGLNTIPETAALIISPITTTMYFILMMMVALVYFVYVWFKCMGAFFKTPEGEPVELITNPINYMIACGFVILFIIVLFLVIGAVPLLNSGMLLMCLLTTIGYKAAYLGTQSQSQPQNVTIWKIIGDVFIYHKPTLAWIFSILFVIITFTNLGAIPGIIGILLIGLIKWGKLGVPLFVPESPPLGLVSPFIDNVKQAAKTCMQPEPTRTHKGVVGQFFDLFKNPQTTTGGGTSTPVPIPILNKAFLTSMSAL